MCTFFVLKKQKTSVEAKLTETAEAKQALAVMLGYVGHEIRNPLNGIFNLLLFLSDHADEAIELCNSNQIDLSSPLPQPLVVGVGCVVDGMGGTETNDSQNQQFCLFLNQLWFVLSLLHHFFCLVLFQF